LNLSVTRFKFKTQRCKLGIHCYQKTQHKR